MSFKLKQARYKHLDKIYNDLLAFSKRAKEVHKEEISSLEAALEALGDHLYHVGIELEGDLDLICVHCMCSLYEGRCINKHCKE